MPDTRMICETCLRPVSRMWGADTHDEEFVEGETEVVAWVHTDRPSDEPHDVVPIPAESAPAIDQVCDFCSQPNIAWIFPTDRTRRQIAPGVFQDDTAWAACQACHDDILDLGQDAPTFVGRVKARLDIDDSSIPEPIRSILNNQWAQTFALFLRHRHDPVTLSEWVAQGD